MLTCTASRWTRAFYRPLVAYSVRRWQHTAASGARLVAPTERSAPPPAEPSDAPTDRLVDPDDGTVNLVWRLPQEHAGAALEARSVSVRDGGRKLSVYLSSHTGCNRGCRFCHLTLQRQAAMRPATLDEYVRQMDGALRASPPPDIAGTGVFVGGNWRIDVGPRRLNVNFMARGEPLLNPNLATGGDARNLFSELDRVAAAHGWPAERVRYNVSTIFPKAARGAPIEAIAPGTNAATLAAHRALWGDDEYVGPLGPPGRVWLYYSLYSVNEAWREKYMPAATPARDALERLARYQRATGSPVVLHWAWMAGQNDGNADLDALCETLRAVDLRGRFQQISFNPPVPGDASALALRGWPDLKEPSPARLDYLFQRVSACVRAPDGLPMFSKRIDRVGRSVKAYCGGFVPPAERAFGAPAVVPTFASAAKN